MAQLQAPVQQSFAPVDPIAHAPRLMQIKVLYTFDDEKSTCLARCPYPVNVHTLAIDENTHIGIVELRTCIQAIVTASPELIAKLGQDYTVYAYDYSEYETPLVGQGMLSWALASASATPNAPAHQSQTPVTGRVVQNTRSLFPSSGPAEMLQVKLKLVPVPTCLQSEYLSSMQKYRDASNITSQGFDPSAWTAFLKTESVHPGSTQPQRPVQHDSTTPGPAFNPLGQAIAPSSPQQPPEQFIFQHTVADGLQPLRPTAARKHSSRPATPKARSAASQSRPSSRNSNRDRPPLKSAVSCASRVESVRPQESIELDDGQSRKRARVEQTDWRGPSAFEGREDSLRVSASVAASVRGHKPPTAFASISDMDVAEPGLRPPTPRPSHRMMRTHTSLEHETITQKSQRYQSPYTTDADQPESSASVGDSPENHGHSKASTPMEVPSSPPMNRDCSPIPSSPALPRLANHVDSGFVSGSLDECLDADDEMRPPDNEDLRNASWYNRRSLGLTSELSFFEETPGDRSLLPQRNVQIPRPRNNSGGGVRRRQGDSIAGSSPRLPPLLSSCDNEDVVDRRDLGIVHAQPHPTSEPTALNARSSARPGLPTQRSGSVKMEHVTTCPESGNESSKAQEGSGLKRKKAIQNRMNQDIAAGEMPPYCHNCGEIDTPTWRKCFVKIEQGSPTHLQLSDSEDGLMAWEALSKSADNVITSYRMVKKNLKARDTGFDELKLCNACGMWLFKIKSMRPPHKWTKPAPKQPTRKRPSRSRGAKCTKEVDSDAVDPDEAALVQALTADNAHSSNEFALTDVSGRSDKTQPKTIGKRKRAISASSQVALANVTQMSDAVAAAALQRAIKSSPPKFPGSKTLPIELDGEENTESVRRVLFPSPCRNGELRTLGETSVTSLEPTPSAAVATSRQENADPQHVSPSIGWVPYEKESMSSSTTTSSPYNALFMTPTRSASRGLTPRGPLSSGKRRRSDPETPTRAAMRDTIAHGEMTPFTAQLSALISEGTSDPNFNFFGDMAPMPSDNDGMFDFSDFNDNYREDWGAMPQSDGDFFPVYEDADMEMWNGGPLLEGELDELLKDAGEDAVLNPAVETASTEGQIVDAIGATEEQRVADTAAGL